MGEQTTILPLLNGIAHLEHLDAAFGAPRVIAGAAYISVTLAGDGTIRHLNKLDGLTFGEREDGQSARCDAIEAVFAKAPFSGKRSTAVMQEMWEMLDECQAVAAAAGFPVQEKSRKFATGFLTDRDSDFTASMLRDLENGQQVEADQLPGDMIRRGAAHGVATDLLRVAFCHLQAYQNRRGAP